MCFSYPKKEKREEPHGFSLFIHSYMSIFYITETQN